MVSVQLALIDDKELAEPEAVRLHPHLNKLLQGRAEDILKQIESESVDLVVTSPPYADQRKLKRLYIDIEKEKKYWEIAEARVKETGTG